jgi:tripartite-type tricarboxylate transporter receptor subunit TctC
MAPPGVPAERVEALRKAFNDTVTDPEFVTEAEKRGMHVQLVTGQEIEDVLRRVYAMPKEIVERVRAAVK